TKPAGWGGPGRGEGRIPSPPHLDGAAQPGYRDRLSRDDRGIDGLSGRAGRMNARRTRLAGLLGMALCSSLWTGCGERRYIITADAPGGNPSLPRPAAVVYENGRPIGAAPADQQFLYYGTYRFTIVRDGCKTLVVDQCIKAPWYEYFPLDFISENLLPWTIRDVRHFH